MQQKAILVTGAGQGIGKAIAELAIERGATKVALVDKNEESLNKVVAALEAKAEQVVGIVADLRARKSCHDAFSQALSALGNIDVLVNNAGIYIYTPIEQIDDEEWDLVMDVCLRNLFHLSVAGALHMKARGGGRIVNIASVDGFVPLPEMAHYAAAKAGVISLTRTFAAAYASDGILVNAVAPGLTDTPRVRANNREAAVVGRIPLGRLATEREIAEAVCFLGGASNTYMTGEVMNVSGGLVIA